MKINIKLCAAVLFALGACVASVRADEIDDVNQRLYPECPGMEIRCILRHGALQRECPTALGPARTQCLIDLAGGNSQQEQTDQKTGNTAATIGNLGGCETTIYSDHFFRVGIQYLSYNEAQQDKTALEKVLFSNNIKVKGTSIKELIGSGPTMYGIYIDLESCLEVDSQTIKEAQESAFPLLKHYLEARGNTVIWHKTAQDGMVIVYLLR